MTINPAAQPLIDFIDAHGLSIRSVARAADTDEGTIRQYRDVPNRRMNIKARVAIAKALHVLTQEKIDIVKLFGVAEDSPRRREINIKENINLSMLLKEKNLTPKTFARALDIPFDAIIDLLMNKEVAAEYAERVKAYFKTEEIYDRDQWRFAVLRTDSVMEDEADLEDRRPVGEMTTGELQEHVENFRRAGEWWDKLQGLVRENDREGIGKHLAIGVPAFWLSTKQLVAIELVIRYIRESRGRARQSGT